jgi:Undecaprenyl-phosphate glucose phosphotransferase
MLKKHQDFFKVLQVSSDFVIVFVSWMISFFIRFHFLPDAEQGLESFFAKIGLVNSFLTIYVLNKDGLYLSKRFKSKFSEFIALFKSNSWAFILLILGIYFFFPSRVSRLHLLLYGVSSTFLLLVFRILIRNYLRLLRKSGKNLRHFLLVGNGKQVEQYVKAVRLHKDCGIKFMAWHDSEGMNDNHKIDNLDVLNQDYLMASNPDGVVIGYSNDDFSKVSAFLKNYSDNVYSLQVLPDLSFSMVGHQIDDFDGIPLINLNNPTLGTMDAFLKRIMDFSLALVTLILISPLLIIISILVKISSPGPILFGQKRMGLDGREFTMWKFRSMKVADGNVEKTEWSNKVNPRKTKVGDFLRKTSMDELPQFWNVLIGDMSLVGPRPEQPHFVTQFKEQIPGYMLRHKMKAGITGWAQINGLRGDTSIEKRIELDHYYIRNWSMWFDLKILMLTPIKGLVNKNAY